MNSADLTAEQLAALLRSAKAHAAFLQSLFDRIEQQQFPALDPLRLRTLGTLDQIEPLVQLPQSLADKRRPVDLLIAAKSKREFNRLSRDRRKG